MSKSTGLDKIPAKVLKIASSIIAPSLTFIFNLSLSSGIFIDDWKNARVCPVYKGNDCRDMGNYRPISILPIISFREIRVTIDFRSNFVNRIFII